MSESIPHPLTPVEQTDTRLTDAQAASLQPTEVSISGAPVEATVHPRETEPISTVHIRNSLLDEILRTRGMDPQSWVRSILEPLVSGPIDRFIQMIAEVDRRTADHSFLEASRWLLPQFARGVEVIGVDNVPSNGPVLFVSNHPGNFDEVVITANVPRPDLRIFANSHPILTSFPALSRHLVFSKVNDPGARMNALRNGIRNLRQGSSLLIFPTGRTDPDPRSVEGAGEAIENWSPSVELLVNKAPETRVIITLVSGVVSQPIFNNPLLKLRRPKLERQKLAGTIQMAMQVLFPRLFNIVPRVSFSRPFDLAELTDDGARSVQRGIIEQAQSLLHLHTADMPVVPPLALQPSN